MDRKMNFCATCIPVLLHVFRSRKSDSIPQYLELKLHDELEFLLHHPLESKPLEHMFAVEK